MKNPIKNMKFNPLWLAFGTVWVPSVIAKYVVLPLDIKTFLIYAVIAFQIYFLFVGINRLKEENKKKARPKRRGQ